MNEETQNALDRLIEVCNKTALKDGQVIVGLSDLRLVLRWIRSNTKTPGEIDREQRKVAAYDAIVDLFAQAVNKGSR